MGYRTPVSEIMFLLRFVLGYGRVSATERFGEATDEIAEAILTEAAKLSEDILAPLNPVGDRQPATLRNGAVTCSPGFREGYRAIAEGGWIGISAPREYGGMELPTTLQMAVGESMSSACLALSLNPLMSQGHILALVNHADEEICTTYVPRLVSGEWTGTMNLTEPQAGSDVGAIRCKARPKGDGSYAITGTKVFISWGDHDLAGNICHLVLARLPGSDPGTRGISMFLVPKYIPGPEGKPGETNRLRPVSLECKLGMHGSPTAVMAYEGAVGWLVGQPGKGLAAMFTMMNNARLGVAVQGVGVAEAATQAAIAYARDREQGTPPTANGAGPIIEHPDVRRMIMHMMALTTAARALCLDAAISCDMARATGDAGWAGREAFLTPIAKAFSTDVAAEVADLGIQVHGGAGYIEETGAAQLWRDVRVTRIYEGTNGIQANDLVGRKLTDGGEMARSLISEIGETVSRTRHGPATTNRQQADLLNRAAKAVAEATGILAGFNSQADRQAGAAEYLRSFAVVLGGHYLLRASLAREASSTTRNLAEFYCGRILPAAITSAEISKLGSRDLYAMSRSDFQE